jgi:hypothetical protein
METQREETLVRHSCKWKDNIKMSIKDTEVEDMDWIHVAQD